MGDGCRVCGDHKPARRFTLREMMFGTKEEFEYQQCHTCGSLQIVEIPSPGDMARHYPEDYYSFAPDAGQQNHTGLKAYLQARRDDYELGLRSLVGLLFAQVKPLPVRLQLLRLCGIGQEARILDVGCGGGTLLDFLASKGFTRLRGADPFNGAAVVTTHGVRIDNCAIEAIDETFDVVMFHHALEHVPDPVGVLRKVHDVLAPSGLCIVRIPTCSSEAWDRYGADWVQLDPPRHLTVPSRLGMDILGRRSGLTLDKTIDDSTAFQFWASEQYVKNVSLLRNGVTTQIGIPALAFGDETLRGYEREAGRLNAQHRGDQAAFIFRKAA